MKAAKPNRRQFLASTTAGLVGVALPIGTLAENAEPENPNPVISQKVPDSVRIQVDAASDLGELSRAWAFFGHDEANYSYTENGKKLLADLSALSPVPVFMRAHHLFTSGDPATTALKWSPTNVYTEDGNGQPIYDWRTLDRMFDNYLAHGIKPLVELGFMPKALSAHPEPYDYVFKTGDVDDYGWTHPPKDYGKWAALVTAFVEHFKEKYGTAELESWYWEVWNEPDIFFWQGTTGEYLKLYDYSAQAVKQALPNARLGGPTSTAPKSEKSAIFLREFLQHCASGRNFATGGTGAPLDYISFHTKGAPKMADGKVQMGMQTQLKRAQWAFSIIAEFPEFKHLPVIIGESDPEGTAAYNVADRPENVYRQGAIYPAYNASVYKKLHEIAASFGLKLVGNLTWAFLFENQPYFAGFRELATNGINKAVLNGFRMLGLMTGHRLAVRSDAAYAPELVIASGVVASPDVDALAAADANSVTVLVWNYHDVDEPTAPVEVKLEVHSLALPAGRVLLEHFRVDHDHSNAFTAWQKMGSPQPPSSAQLRTLQEASELALLESPEWVNVERGQVSLAFKLPRYGLSLLRLSLSQ